MSSAIVKMNLGCGPDIKEGWMNVDSVYQPNIFIWDCRSGPLSDWLDAFDFILVNHVLCTMNYDDVNSALRNIKTLLKPNGIVQIIDMNLLKAFYSYQSDLPDFIPIEGGTIDYKLCMHISGFSTRKSLYTPQYMVQLLDDAGFQNANIIQSSKYDSRPKESLIVEAIK